ncbi:MAG: DNA-directed RNA polymerase subunit H [Candidatus Diapherotrites archaeon]|nr:DNA-directed RNA polymerase subunit H [Candidatus Diapherotrites archaeon]
MAFDVKDHILVPKHVLLSKKDIEELLQKTHFKIEELPQIQLDDPAIKHLEPEKGDIIKIARVSNTAGKSIYYRRVV